MAWCLEESIITGLLSNILRQSKYSFRQNTASPFFIFGIFLVTAFGSPRLDFLYVSAPYVSAIPEMKKGWGGNNYSVN